MQQKTILITGAGSGIGRAVARYFVERGWWAGLYDLDVSAVEQLLAELGEARARAGKLDVTDNDSVEDVIADFAGWTDGRMDVLFNCAGLLSIGAFESIPLDRHLAIADVNFAGLIRMTYAAFPHLRDTPSARVINMASASADYGVPEFASYSATKFAVRGLTEALNLEWQRHGIYVCDIMPPFVRTPMLDDAPMQVGSIQRLGVNLGPEDVAQVVFRAANASRQPHWPVSLQFKILYYLGQVLPAWLKRLTMRVVSGC